MTERMPSFPGEASHTDVPACPEVLRREYGERGGSGSVKLMVKGAIRKPL